MKYKIVSDSSSNIMKLKNINFQSVPMKIICKGKEYVDNENLDVGAMVEKFKHTKDTSTTSCPNTYDWLDAFNGEENIFAFTVTSTLSGSYNSAMNAKKIYENENENAKVCVIDSLTAGPEIRLLTEKVISCGDNGMDFETTQEEVMEYKKHTHTVFSLKSMNNLARNGRISLASAKVALVLGIRVVGKASEQGTLQPLHKCRGEAKGLQTMYDVMVSEGFCGGKVRISHCNNADGAKKLENIIKDNYPKCEIKTESCTALCSYYAEDGGLIVGYEG